MEDDPPPEQLRSILDSILDYLIDNWGVLDRVILANWIGIIFIELDYDEAQHI